MSKAFTSESDDEEESFQPTPLPAGVRNYITPRGAERLRREKEALLVERAHLGTVDFEELRRRKAIERRLDFLISRLETLVVLEPTSGAPDQVRFGARVTVENEHGAAESWQIVGLDEVDLAKNAISWMSPLATALLEKKVGDEFVFQTGRRKILRVEYP